MRAISVVLFFMSATFFAIAEDARSDNEFSKIIISGVEHNIEKTSLQSYKDGLMLASGAIEKCAPTSLKISHPLNGRDSVFTVSKIGSSCLVNYVRDSRWSYTCTLNSTESNEMAELLTSWAEAEHGLGDFPENLQVILFDKEICDPKLL